MPVRIAKPAVNIREKLAELERPIGLNGSALMRTETPQEAFSLIGAGRKNLIINGDMQIDQRNAGSSVTVPNGTPTFSVDRFRFAEGTSASSCTLQQVTDAPVGFTNSLKITVGTGGSATASQIAQLCHPIEGFNWAPLLYGSTNARTFTVQFWVKSSIPGIYCFSLFNSAGNRSYVAEYTINAANTWEYKTITVPGDTTGTWLVNNGVGAFINWDFGAGTDFNTTKNTWGTTSYASRTTNQVNWISNSGATFFITGVQLEIGKIATPFEYLNYGDELAMCQRYFTKIIWSRDEWAWANNSVSDFRGTHYDFPVEMRSNPTFTVIQGWNLYQSTAAFWNNANAWTFFTNGKSWQAVKDLTGEPALTNHTAYMLRSNVGSNGSYTAVNINVSAEL